MAKHFVASFHRDGRGGYFQLFFLLAFDVIVLSVIPIYSPGWREVKKGKGKATSFIHGLCLKLEACGAVYMKQILNKHNTSNKHNMVKNPNWQEADQLAIYKHDRELNSGQPRANPDSGLNRT